MSSNVTATAAAAEACRVAHVAEWVPTSNSSIEYVVSLGTLQSIQQTNELFPIAESFCQGYINAYNIAAGRTCILQQQPSPSSSDEGMTNVTYTEFWEGAANMDGSYTLAAIFDRTNNFTSGAQLYSCSNDCYVSGDGEPGCIYGQSFLPLIGQIPQSHVCYNEWSEMDEAYNELRVCAATAVFDSDNHYDDAANLDEQVTVAMYQEQRDKSVSCALKACRTSKSASTQLTPPGGRRGGVVIIVSSLMMLFLVTYT